MGFGTIVGGGNRLETMDWLYERAFGPPLDARKEVVRNLRQHLANLKGLDNFEYDEENAEWLRFTLSWKHRGKEKSHRFKATLQLTEDYTSMRIPCDAEDAKLFGRKIIEAKELLEKNREAWLLGRFFLQLGGWLNVRDWPPCRKCGATDVTIDYARVGFDVDHVVYFPILEQKHTCFIPV